MNKLRLLTLKFMLLTVVGLFAAYNKTTYYSNANGKSGATLKTALYTIINGSCDGSSFQQIEYGSGYLKGIWGAFQDTDCNGTTIIDRYSSKTSYTVGTDQGSSSSTEGTGGYNREHSFPKSWFGGSTSAGPGTDLFHIYPTDVMVNNKRSAYPFGEVKSATFTSSTEGGWCSKFGTGGYGSNTNYTVFEPADRWKGDFARAYFYMVTCYENSIVSWYNTYNSTEVKYVLNGTKHPAFQTWQLQMLLAWAEADPVDDLEVARNEAVMSYQHNRNPFIDFPGLEQYIWGSYSTSYSSYQTTALSVSNYVDPYGGSSTDTPSISISLASTSIAEGGTASLTATVSNASGATVKWTTSDSSVASLNPTTGNSTTVEGISAGTATITASINVDGTTYSATCVVTVTSSGSGTGSGAYYAKVTSAPSDWSGTYLIVCESNTQVLNGTTPTAHSDVTIANNTIESNATTDSYAVTITSKTNGYSIKGASLYIGHTGSSNALSTSSTDDFTNTITLSGGDVTITCNSRILKYNASGSGFFRYYASGQTAIQLYKKESSGGSTTTDPINPTTYFATQSVGLTVGDTYTQTVNTNSDGAVTYSVSPTSVATIDSRTGEVTAVGAGTATVTATTAATNNYNSGSATYQIIVSPAAVPSITVTPSTASVEVDGTVALSASKENASSANITWSCTPSGIVSLSTTSGSSVTVTGLSAGTATVTASITVGNTTYTDDCIVTVTASGGSSSEHYYAKVTSAPDDWSGTYLIVYEGGNLAMNGALTADANSNYISVTISDNKIAVTDATEAAEFTITSMNGGYGILAKGGKYIGGSTSQNNVSYNSSAILNTLDISSGNVTIVSNARTLCYRDEASANQTRFRYFKNASSYNAIQLYKKVASSDTEPETPVTITTGSGTAEEPYTVADVLLMFNNSSVPSNAVYVSGIVSQINEVSTGYGNATYFISDDGTTDNQFYVFRGKYLDNASFTSTDQLQVGDTVVINGTLTTYNTTNEFAANNYIVSLVRPVVAVDPEFSFAVTSKDLKVGETYIQAVTTNSDGTVAYTSSNTSVVTVDASTGLVTAVGAGSATITAIVEATSAYNAGTATYSVSVILLGDVDNDGAVTPADLAVLVRILLGGDTTGCNLEAADVDGQNGITLADLTALVNLLNAVEE